MSNNNQLVLDEDGQVVILTDDPTIFGSEDEAVYPEEILELEEDYD